MWRHICQSVQGSVHNADGSACQDYCAVRTLGAGDAATLVACVADGAGSTRFGGIGARMACETIVEHAVARFDADGSLAELTADDVLAWCDLARTAIAEHAETTQSAFREFASTLCVAITAPGKAVFLQIGDGAIVASRHGAMGVAFWPQSGEYINTTHFLTSPDFRDRVQTLAVDCEFSDLALLTDGIERLALRFDSLTPHPPFFAPLFQALRNTANAAGLERDLRQFLLSEFMQNKTDDDRTLVLAARVD